MSRRGIVRVGVAPIRRSPDHRTEQVTQGLLGEEFQIEDEAEDGAWWQVRLQTDGYRGWLRSWYGQPLEEQAAAEWSRTAPACIRTALEVVRASPRRTAEVIASLPWQARVRAGEAQAGWVRVDWPGGEGGFVPASSLVLGQAPGGPATPSRLLRTARLWMGAPYLWGGRTPGGFDCSGLTQAVWAWHGQSLPRDAVQQYDYVAQAARRRGRGDSAPAGNEAKAGDLLFFGQSFESVGHVAISAGNGEFIHAYGTVCRGSLSDSSQVFTPKLVRSYLGAWPARP